MEIRNSLTGNTAKKSVHDLCTNVVEMLGMLVTRLTTPLTLGHGMSQKGG